MRRTCPKCSYIRQPTDDNPAWQCPSCHVAYNKVDGSADMANYGRYSAPIVKNDPQRSGMLKWILFAAVIGAGIAAGKSLWHANKPQHAMAADASQPKVILYGTEWCGYCAATREFFAENGIQYTDMDVEKSSEGYEGHKKLGGDGVPLVVIGDDVIHGFNEEKMRADLRPWLKGS